MEKKIYIVLCLVFVILFIQTVLLLKFFIEFNYKVQTALVEALDKKATPGGVTYDE